MKRTLAKWVLLTASAIVAVGVGVSAHAYTLTCGAGCPTGAAYEINSTDAIGSGAELATETGNAAFAGLSRLLKQDAVGSEEGSLAPYYTIAITGPGGDEFNNFTVTYNGGDKFSCPTCVLVVKDGSQGDPAQYAFNLGSWNGETTITGTGFWLDPLKGSISHVSIFGGATSVPEPTSLMLLGAGLAGLGIWSWRRKSGQI